jgi:DNA-binding MarR family transcriptional regulator
MANKTDPARPDETGGVPQRLMGAFMRINRQHWHRHVSADLRPHEFSLLHAIRKMSAENEAGPRASDLSLRLNVTPPTITQQVSELERRGLLERRRDPSDRRSVRVVLSPEGIALLERNRASILTLFVEISDYLGPDRSETLTTLLGEAADYLEESNEKTRIFP